MVEFNGQKSFIYFPSTIYQSTPDSEWFQTNTPAQFSYERDGKIRRVVVGAAVREQDLPGSKKMNLSAADSQYEDLLLASFLQTVPENIEDISLVCGFPKATLPAQTNHLSTLKGKTYSVTTPHGIRRFSIREIWPLPEALGHGYGIREAMNLDGKLFSVSIGFGTLEICVIGADGRPLINSIFSEPLGIRHAALTFKELIQKQGHHTLPTNGGSDAWWDSILYRSYHEDKELVMLIDGRPLDGKTLRNLATKALTTYCDTVVADRLEQQMNDANTGRMYFALTGGGRIYAPVRDRIEAMAAQKGFNILEISDELALKSALLGYSYAARTSSTFSSQCVAVDIGNSNTVSAFLL